MNLKTAALRLGVHYQTAYRWVRSGQLVAVKVGAGYEISDAARRAAPGPARRDRADARAGRARSARRRSATAAASVDDALHVLDLMVDAVTLDSTAVGERAARVVGRAPRRHRVPVSRRTPAGDAMRGRLRRAPRSGRRGRGVDPRARSAHRRPNLVRRVR